jgi:hypothetical protein
MSDEHLLETNNPYQEAYEAPRILLELILETRAGSSLGLPDLDAIEE